MDLGMLRGADGQVMRRRNVQYEGQQQTAEIDRFHYNDPLGTIKEQGEPDRGGEGTVNGYVISAEGEPLPISGGQPTEENHIRFHGGFLEDKEFHTSAGPDHGHLYHMGVRHYSPALGRFLQREPATNFDLPNLAVPLSANPYSYGFNNALMYTDPSGRQAVFGGGCCGGGAIGPIPRNPGDPVDPHKPPWFGPGGVYYPEPPGGGRECAVKWPKESNCGLCGLWCCRFVGDSKPTVNCDSPCPSDYVCFAGKRWSIEECIAWCCANWQEENAPSRQSYAGGSIIYYGPPRIGPNDRGGDLWWWWSPEPSPIWPKGPNKQPDIHPLNRVAATYSPLSVAFMNLIGSGIGFALSLISAFTSGYDATYCSFLGQYGPWRDSKCYCNCCTWGVVSSLLGYFSGIVGMFALIANATPIGWACTAISVTLAVGSTACFLIFCKGYGGTLYTELGIGKG